jgi:hypothetical protein
MPCAWPVEAPRDESAPPPAELDLIGTRYSVPVYWLEEIATLLRAGKSDAEVLALVQTPTDDVATRRTIPLPEEQCTALVAEVRRFIGG